MSHTVTITRTTTSSASSPLFMNTGYLKTFPGLLKLLQLCLGAACVGVICHYMDNVITVKAELFFLLMAVTFLVGTFCLLLSCIVSLSTASIISKTIYELVYHGVAFILYLAAGLTLLIEVNHWSKRSSKYEPYLAASIIGLVLAALYLVSAFLASRTYRGI